MLRGHREERCAREERSAENRTARCRHVHRDAMLALREPVERLRLHGLEPHRAAKRSEELEGEEGEEETDAAVGEPRHRLLRSRNFVVDGSAG